MIRIELLTLAALLLAVGCGADPDPNQRVVFPVKGTVMFRGEPIPDATVRLHPVKKSNDGKPLYIPRGFVDESGTFQVSTYSQGDGAPAGDYIVSVSWQGPLSGLSEDEQDRLKELLPREYTSPRSSGLNVTIQEGDNELPPITIQ